MLTNSKDLNNDDLGGVYRADAEAIYKQERNIRMQNLDQMIVVQDDREEEVKNELYMLLGQLNYGLSESMEVQDLGTLRLPDKLNVMSNYRGAQDVQELLYTSVEKMHYVVETIAGSMAATQTVYVSDILEQSLRLANIDLKVRSRKPVTRFGELSETPIEPISRHPQYAQVDT